jgi:hypothetical protein
VNRPLELPQAGGGGVIDEDSDRQRGRWLRGEGARESASGPVTTEQGAGGECKFNFWAGGGGSGVS